MADLQKTIEIIFSGTNNLGGMISQVTEQYDAVEGSIAAIGDAVTELPGEKDISIDVLGDWADTAAITDALAGLPDMTEISVDVLGDWSDIGTITDEIGRLPVLTEISVDVTADGSSINTITDAIGALPDATQISIDVSTDWAGIGPLTDAIDQLPASKQIVISTLADPSPITTITQALESLPATKSVTIDVENEGVTSILNNVESITNAIVNLPGSKEIGIKAALDFSSLETAYGALIQRFPDDGPNGETVRITNIKTEMSVDEWNKAGFTKEKLDTMFPSKKDIEIQAKLDVAKIKADADIIQKSVEWKAKVDIADIESQTKIIEAMFKSIDNIITSTGTTLTSIIGDYTRTLNTGGSSFIEDQIRMENNRRDAALGMQEKLTAAEVDNIKARTRALESGNAMIQIDGKGLQPHLEAFMFEILSAIQIRANAEGQKYLVGL